MDILKEIEIKDKELGICYSLIQLQKDKIDEMIEKIHHLEKLLMYKAEIIEIDKE